MCTLRTLLLRTLWLYCIHLHPMRGVKLSNENLGEFFQTKNIEIEKTCIHQKIERQIKSHKLSNVWKQVRASTCNRGISKSIP